MSTVVSKPTTTTTVQRRRPASANVNTATRTTAAPAAGTSAAAGLLSKRAAHRPAPLSAVDTESLKSPAVSNLSPPLSDGLGHGAPAATSSPTASAPDVTALLSQCYDGGAFAARVGLRMKHYRTAAGITAEHMASHVRLHNAEAYLKVERGASPMELWGPLIGIFAVNLGVACKYLDPNGALPPEMMAASGAALGNPPGNGNERGGSEESAAAAGHSSGSPSRRGSNASSASTATAPAPSTAAAAAQQPGSPGPRPPSAGSSVSPGGFPGSPTASGGGHQPQHQHHHQRASYGLRVKAIRVHRSLAPHDVLGAALDTTLSLQEFTVLENGGSGGGYERWAQVLFCFAELCKVPVFTLVADVVPQV